MSDTVDIMKSIMGLLSGIAIFLYAMKMTSNGLESIAGNHLKTTLQKLTSNRVVGVIVGTLITALVQSSTTTTVMVVGFVNAKLMDLYQALWIIMGSNIGTNITSQLIAFNVGEFAPIVAIVGICVVFGAKSKKKRSLGDVITGIGFIFVGMTLMTSSMKPIVDLPIIKEYVAKMENPFLGILCGIILVFIIQNSAAGVGLLQAMAMAGTSTAVATNSITVDQALFILFGLNIGTCFHALLSAIGGKRDAVKAALLHMFFNVIGTIIFTPIALYLPFSDFIRSLSPNDVPRQIANTHLIFNLGTTILMLPLGQFLVRFVMRILPSKEEEDNNEAKLIYLTPSLIKEDVRIGLASTMINACYSEVVRMYKMTQENISRSFDAVINNTEKLQNEINKSEECIDFLNKEITNYISHGLGLNLPEEDILRLNILFKVTGNIERMGDHATNIAGYASLMQEKGYKLSSDAFNEIEKMKAVFKKASDALLDENLSDKHIVIAQAEQKIDDMTDEYREHQMRRMKDGVCSGEACVIYSEMLTDFERLGDHLLNIAEAVSQNKMNEIRYTNE